MPPSAVDDLVDLTIPAYSEVLGESLTLTLPFEWHPLVEALAEAGCTVYGPRYSRQTVEVLRDLTYLVKAGYRELALERLMKCHAKIASSIRWDVV